MSGGPFYEEISMSFYEVRNSFLSKISNSIDVQLETNELNNILIDSINEYLNEDYLSYDDDLFNLKLSKLGSIRGFMTFSEKPLFVIFNKNVQKFLATSFN